MLCRNDRDHRNRRQAVCPGPDAVAIAQRLLDRWSALDREPQRRAGAHRERAQTMFQIGTGQIAGEDSVSVAASAGGAGRVRSRADSRRNGVSISR